MIPEEENPIEAAAWNYELEMRARARLTASDARVILDAHGVELSSRANAAEAKALVLNEYPLEAEALIEGKVAWLRWPVAHALGIGMAELASIEEKLGIEIIPGNDGSNGSYTSLSDAVKVMEEARSSLLGPGNRVHVRLGTTEGLGPEDMEKVYETLSASFNCTDPIVRTEEGRTRTFENMYFDVLVPPGTGEEP